VFEKGAAWLRGIVTKTANYNLQQEGKLRSYLLSNRQDIKINKQENGYMNFTFNKN